MPGLTAEQVDLMARGAVDQAIAAGQAALDSVLTALSITMDDDQRDIAGIAISAGTMAGVDAMSTVLRATGAEAPVPCLPVWVERCVTRAGQVTHGLAGA